MRTQDPLREWGLEVPLVGEANAPACQGHRAAPPSEDLPVCSPYYKWGHSLRESKGRSRHKPQFFFQTQENNAKFPLFEGVLPALFNAFAFQEQNRS